jgi:hypothetical protein
VGQFLGQTGLSHTWLTAHEYHAAAAASGLIEQAPQLGALGLPADEWGLFHQGAAGERWSRGESPGRQPGDTSQVLAKLMANRIHGNSG